MAAHEPGAPAVVGPERLGEVLAALERGELVALPTDTVYGLAARIDRPDALAGLFAAKGRPPGLALPVLIGHWRQRTLVAAAWPPSASALAARFWPGPLTVVVPARVAVGPLLGGDGRTVGLRRPDHALVQECCRRGGPLAVTSANRHGAPPCTTATDVAAAFGRTGPTGTDGTAAVAVVLDGGLCDGAPSTVVDCTVSPPACLRDGGVPWPSVEAELR